ncbi:MAG: hypothetical protein FWD66_06010 [Paludibacter sp.]|nr:hypothetical protein [Paludibacter sp.]
MSSRTKISAVLTAISFCILLIPIVLQKDFFLSDNFNYLITGFFAVSLIAAIFSLIKDKNGFSIMLVFITSISLISLLLNNYNFQKIFFSDKMEEVSDSLFFNQNYDTQLTDKQLLTDYQKATGNQAIAVLELNNDYTVFLLSVNKKTSPDISTLEFDYEISEFASAELEARKSYSAIIIFKNQTDNIVKIRQNSVSFFSNGQNIGTENFHSQYTIIRDEKKIDLLQKIINYL